MKIEGLPRHTILKSPLKVSRLFTDGKSFNCFPLKIMYQCVPAQEKQLHVAFSVGKRNFRRAVDRNYLKRLMRESFRKQRQQFLDKLPEDSIDYQIVVIYTGRKIVAFTEVKHILNEALMDFCNVLENHKSC